VARRSGQRLGSRAADVLDEYDPNPVVCECEGVTRAEVQDAIGEAGSDLNAVRIRTRASMGNCQGGFCTHRIAAELAQEYPEPVVRDAEDELYPGARKEGPAARAVGMQLAAGDVEPPAARDDDEPRRRPGEPQQRGRLRRVRRGRGRVRGGRYRWRRCRNRGHRRRGSMAIDSDVLVVGGGSPRSPRRSRRPAKAPTCGWSPTRRARSDRPPG